MNFAMRRTHYSLDPVRHAGTFGAAALVAVVVGGFAASASAATYEGAEVHVGDGFARTVVHTDFAGKPASIAVMLSRDAMRGLPDTPNAENPVGAWQFSLPMPQDGPETGIRAVVIDWNPHGHPPPHIYDSPHFDFHFYAIGTADLRDITFTGPDDPATRVTDAALIAEGYQVIPETAVDRMGVHAIDTAAPEFHGKPFTSTFIYGYYDGGLIFVEPMVTRDFLLAKPDFSAPVKTPEHVSLSGHYPTSYSVRYDQAAEAWLIALDGLAYRGYYPGITQ